MKKEIQRLGGRRDSCLFGSPASCEAAFFMADWKIRVHVLIGTVGKDGETKSRISFYEVHEKLSPPQRV